MARLLDASKPTLRLPWLSAVAAVVCFGAGTGLGAALTYRAGGAVSAKVDFTFQILNMQTPRQENKTMNVRRPTRSRRASLAVESERLTSPPQVFVRLRYPEDQSHCPFSPTDNTCIQYQLKMRQLILDVALRPTPALPMDAEWERVTLALCRGIFDGGFPIIAVSTLVQVNGDGRDAAERGPAPYEPGAHSATCTIGPSDFLPIDRFNYLPNLGPY